MRKYLEPWDNGEATGYTDRNGSVHAYSYDVLGRLTLDDVTTLGSGVDGTVRKLEYSYDTAGLQPEPGIKRDREY